MDERELQARLRAADPARGPQRADSWIEDLVEATMDTEHGMTDTDRRDASGAPRRTWWMAGAAAAVVAAAAGGAFAIAADGGGEKDAPAPTELALSLPPQDAMQMCIEFSPEVLAPVETAFAGTADDVEGDTVRLAVDRWYKGGDADVVVVTAGSPEVLLEGGITFEEGERYLVSANAGEVATCGLSAPYSDEMAAAYDEAFGG